MNSNPIKWSKYFASPKRLSDPSKVLTFTVAYFMNVSIFSSPINIFKSLLKPSHNIESSVLTSSVFLSYKSAILDLAWRTLLHCKSFSGHASEQERRKSRNGRDTSLTTDFWKKCLCCEQLKQLKQSFLFEWYQGLLYNANNYIFDSEQIMI